jgi:hypothetical protein
VAVRGLHHRDLAFDALESNDDIHPSPLERHLTLQLHTKLYKKSFRGLKVLDHEENVVHPSKRHLLSTAVREIVPGRNSDAAR